jgi:hypothetical protein
MRNLLRVMAAADTRSWHEQDRRKVAVVTGGTQGLGAAIARLRAAGAAGIACGRNARRARRWPAHHRRDRRAGGVRRGRPRQHRRRRAVIAAADARFGRLDMLVNAAGLTDRGNLLNTSARAVRPDVRDQRPRAVLPDAGRHEGDDPRGRRGRASSTSARPRARGPAVHRALLRLEGRAGDADPARGLRADAQPHPRQPARHRLDGLGRRGPDPARIPRRRSRLAGQGRAPRSPSGGFSIPRRSRAPYCSGLGPTAG